MSPPPTDELSQSIARVSVAASTTATGEDWPWLFARCWMLANRFDHHGRATADLEAALADFARLPSDAPGRARLAAVLVNTHLRAGGQVLRTPEQIEPVAELAAIADGDPAPFPQWPADRSLVRAVWLMISLQYGRAGVDGRSALAEIEQLAEVVGTTQPHATMIEYPRLDAQHFRTRDDRDLPGMEQLVGQVDRLGAGADPSSPIGLRTRLMSAMQAAMAAIGRGDLVTASTAVERVIAIRRELPADDPMGAQVDHVTSTFLAMTSMLKGTATGGDTGTIVPPSDSARTHFDDLRRRAEQPGLQPTEQAMYLSELGGAEMAMGGPSLDDAVEHLRAAVDIGPADDARRVAYLMSYGTALLLRYGDRRRRRDLADGIDVLEQARRLADGPADPHWSIICHGLGQAYRWSGRRPLGRETGRDGLRHHVWSVLLQSRTDAAIAAARHAARDAVVVARWCLDDNDPAGAALALDAGRGLMLQAAVQFSDVAERLTALDEPALAQRWRQAVTAGGVEQVPIDLRREVVIRLSAPAAPRGAPAAAGRGPALDPPASHEVRAALTKLGADALVYLVPDEEGAGAAVVVSAHDEPSWLSLPQLKAGSSTVLDRYLAEAFTRDTRSAGRDLAADDEDPQDWRRSLDDVCDWAWTAAMGPLLDHLPRRHDLPTDRPPRLVLVPMGELARVPWHAARQVREGQQHHAVDAPCSPTPSQPGCCATPPGPTRYRSPRPGW